VLCVKDKSPCLFGFSSHTVSFAIHLTRVVEQSVLEAVPLEITETQFRGVGEGGGAGGDYEWGNRNLIPILSFSGIPMKDRDGN
jgi:hypothetical protein